MTDIPPEPGTIIEYIERDHLVLRAMVGHFDRTATNEWGPIFLDLVDYLVRHEFAEQEVVFPRVRRALPNVGPTLDDGIAEEHRIEQQLIELSRLEPTSQEFRGVFGRLRDDLDAHLARENLVILPMIRSLGTYEDPDFASSYEVARMSAPSRPEAVLDESEPARRGPVEGLLERLRHAVRSD